MTRTYAERINELIHDLNEEREVATDKSAGRNLSLAITHLEDALFRVGPPLTYERNEGSGRP
jgi:hypothetical protein